LPGLAEVIICRIGGGNKVIIIIQRHGERWNIIAVYPFIPEDLTVVGPKHILVYTPFTVQDVTKIQNIE
jgi:hypothetical protein